MDKFLLNGKKWEAPELESVMGLLNSPQELLARGGLLWKFFWNPEADPPGEWGVLPALVEGERMGHYDIQLRSEDPRTLLGSVSARGEFMILIKMKKDQWTEETRSFAAQEYRVLARVLTKNGYKGRGELDEISKIFLQEAQIFETVPTTLLDLKS